MCRASERGTTQQPSGEPKARSGFERRHYAFGIAFGGLCAAATACILADQPSPIPVAPYTAPVIVTAMLSPPGTSVLTEWPGDQEFTVIVQDQSPPPGGLSAAIFVDYTSSGESLCDSITESVTDFPGGLGQFILDCPPPDGGCHTVEVFVTDGSNAATHSGAATTSTSFTWFYSPSGDLSACPVWDASIIGSADAGDDAAPPDASGAGP